MADRGDFKFGEIGYTARQRNCRWLCKGGGAGRKRANTAMQIWDIADIRQPASGVHGLSGFLAVLD